ncbi:MAG: endonuclease [Planctomycetota bacterium]|nr:MAG: endonuclease [Planctomycetota bacterium]
MQIRMMSWNIHKAIGNDRKFRPERVIEVIRHHRPDVLLMQEVDRGVPRSRRLDLDQIVAEGTGLPYFAWGGNHVLKEGSYGNATLSRFPIRRKRNLDLTIAWKKKRGALFTRLQLPGHFKDLMVFNWHLGLSAQERRRQVERFLRSGTLKGLGKTSRIILGGDTNDWRNLLFRGAGLQTHGFHAWTESGRHKHIATYPSVAPVGPLDKFFWRGGFPEVRVHASKMALARQASDHLPILGEFTLG